MHVVYAADNYNPPNGVIVLPLEAHPAIIEDAQNDWNSTGRKPWRRKTPRPISGVGLRVVEFLRAVGSATAHEVSYPSLKALGFRRADRLTSARVMSALPPSRCVTFRGSHGSLKAFTPPSHVEYFTPTTNSVGNRQYSVWKVL